MQERAKNYSNENLDIQNNLCSCTYIPLEDTIQLHSQQIQNNEIKIIIDDRTDNNNILLPEVSFECRRNWPLIIYPYQKLNGYGA